MALTLTVLDLVDDRSDDVVAEAPPESRTADVLDAILLAAGHPAGTALHLDGRPLDPQAPWSASGVLHGAVLTTEPARHPTAPARLALHVVGGPGAGGVHLLLEGEATIGADPGCTIPLEDPSLPDVCLRLCHRYDGTVGLLPLDGVAATLDREALAPDVETPWPPGTVLAVGDVRLQHAVAPSATVALTPGDRVGRLDHNRPPRLRPPRPAARFVLPARPRRHHDAALPWLVMGLPLVMAVTLALVMREPRYLLMGVFSPLMMAGSHLQSRRGGVTARERAQTEYAERLARLEEDVAAAVAAEGGRRRDSAPDPAAVLRIALGPGPRLWERRRLDPDDLEVRLGLGDLPSGVLVVDPDEPEHRREGVRTGHDLPVTVALGRVGVLGIAGPGDLTDRLAQWAVGQLCVLQSPRDLRLHVLVSPGAPVPRPGAWEWAGWLPHADGPAAVCTESSTAAERVALLTALLSEREAELAGTSRPPAWPAHVVVLDGARRLRSLPGVVALLARGPAVGIHAICLDADEHLLPEEAGAVVTGVDGRLRVREQGEETRDDVLPDLVAQGWAARTARALAPLRDVSEAATEAALPAEVRLCEVLDLDPPTGGALARRWRDRPRSAVSALGVSWDGPHGIDLDLDGPHLLVAGTTGSGKSELLRSLVVSLAVANDPRELSLVLVDYKGGAAFRECADLPHTVGLVTDLDPHLVRRALASLRAELRRRERLLAEAGVPDLRAHVALRERGAPLPALSRLVVVVDEFATLARELPDFVSGLVDVAQRGRSLGLHLVLATQRPSGAVSPEIRANTGITIALRTTDPSESRDVIGTTDAADISPQTPGRAHVRRGSGALVPLQVGSLGAPRPADRAGVRARRADLPWADEHGSVAEAATDLSALVAALSEAAALVGAGSPTSPWLPPLPGRVLLDDLIPPDTTPVAPGALPLLPIALADLPGEQAQRPWSVDLSTLTHLAVVGSRSGRSQTLRTLAGAIARRTHPHDVHLHALDCGNGALRPVGSLPHCGAVVTRAEPERVARLLERLVEELTRRRALLAAVGAADIAEQRRGAAPTDRLPHLLLLLDGWEGFTAAFAESREGRLVEQVHLLLREGAAVGIHVIATGDRSLATLRTGSLFEHRIALRMPDRGDLALVGVAAREVPEHLPDGRGVVVGAATELQVALLDPDPSGLAQSEALQRLASGAAPLRSGPAPFRLDPLPPSITLDAVRSEVSRPGERWALLGVGGDELAPVGLDLARCSTAVVAGAPGSGRSTALGAIAASLLDAGTPLVVLAPRRSPLRDLAGRPGVRAVITDPCPGPEDLVDLLDPGPVCVLIDDGELLRDAPAREVLRDVARLGAESGRCLVLGGDSALLAGGFTGWQSEVAGRQGLLLSPQGPGEGDLIGVRLSRSQVGPSGIPGRGLAHLGDGRLIPVQVPHD